MVTAAKRLTIRERKKLQNRIKACEKRGSLSASLFLEAELNALPEADCFFFYGTKRRCRGVLSVFFPTEKTAEFTAADFSGEEKVLPALFAAALDECRRLHIEEVYTVVNPSFGVQKTETYGARLSYAFSEYFLCCGAGTLAERSAEEPEPEKEKETRGKTVLRCHREADGQRRYCLLWEGTEVSECRFLPFDAGKGWYLFCLETKEEFRRRGFAERLIREAAGELSAAGAERIRLQVSSKNRTAERLYRRLGFRTEEQRDYYRTEEL